jgi:hypothetical protein
MPILLICYHHAYVEQTILLYYLHAIAVIQSAFTMNMAQGRKT